MDHAREPTSRTGYMVWLALLILTAITIMAAHLELGFLSIAAVLAIATTKASLVALYYMHLRYDSRLFAVILLTTLAILAIVLGLTFFDISYRYT